jgi:DNA-binding GntR family transcriptional regulator
MANVPGEKARANLNGLAPVPNRRRRDDATQRIRDALLTGMLVPGQRVKEVDLAAVLKVSRPTAREAMGELIHEGTLIQTPYKGVRVADITAQEVVDVAEVRQGLETIAAQRIAMQTDGRGLTALRAALARHIESLGTGDQVAADLAHFEFHRTIFEASENPILFRIWPLVATKVQLAISMDNAVRHDAERSKALHQRLVEAIADGDPQRIAAEVRRHVFESATEIANNLKERQHLEDAEREGEGSSV